MAYGAEFFRWFAEEAVRVEGRYSTAPAGGYRILTVPKPVGPCVFVTPWNFPLAMGARKIAPALAAGCTTITKPAAQTPLTMLVLARIMEEVGVSPGRRQRGDHQARRRGGLGTAGRPPDPQALVHRVDRGRARAATTGGGQRAAHLDGTGRQRALDRVSTTRTWTSRVDGAMVAKMRNIGESCIAANRIYVEEPVREEFTARFAERMGALSVGHGLDDGVDVGALIDDASVTKIDELVADAVDRGARVLVGGERPDGPGHFYPPTVLVDVPDDARMLAAEIFGPVAPIISFTSDDEVMAKANDTEYGLVGYVFTRDLQRALRFAEGLETGCRHQPWSDLGPVGSVRRREAVRDRQGGVARGHP